VTVGADWQGRKLKGPGAVCVKKWQRNPQHLRDSHNRQLGCPSGGQWTTPVNDDSEAKREIEEEEEKTCSTNQGG